MDLVWANGAALPLVEKLEVICSPTAPDHFPILITLRTRKSDNPTITSEPTLSWKPKLPKLYQQSLTCHPNVILIYTPLEELSKNQTNAINNELYQTGMTYKNKNSSRNRKRKPWFDLKCREIKNLRREHLKDCKKNKFSKEYLSTYLETKNQYNKITLVKKQEYKKNFTLTIEASRDHVAFWKAIDLHRGKNYSYESLDRDIWESYVPILFETIKPPTIQLILLT